jgi:hypothetical protein
MPPPTLRGRPSPPTGVVAACGILLGAALGGSAIELWGFVGMGVIFTGLALLSVLLLARPLEAESLEPTAAA